MGDSDRNPTASWGDNAKRWGPHALLGAAVLAGFYLAQRHSYLLFHTLVEGFAIVVACGVFMLAWNSRRILDNGYILLVGIAYLFIGATDLVHTLAYKGMGVFPGAEPNLATELWIGARYIEAVTLLIAPWMLRVRLRPRLTVAIYALATGLLLASVFSGVFPDCGPFTDGRGLTAFKVASEYIISAILVAAAVFLYRRRAAFDPLVLGLLIASILATIASEMAFTLYADPYDVSNMVGHFLKLVSFYLIYKAVIVTGLTRPYDLLYRRLSRSEEQYHSLFSHMTEGFALHEIITDDAGRPCDYRFVEVNPAFEQLTGLKRDALVGRSVLEVLPGTEARWIENYGRVALTGEPIRFEDYSGSLGRWYEAFAYRPAPGQFAVVFTDITARKKAEQALRDSEEQFRIVADFTYDWEYWRGTDNQFIYMSPSCERITGYTAEEFMADPDLYLRTVHPDDRERIAEHMRDDLGVPDTCEMEFRIVRRDGEPRWIAHACQPVLDGEGRCIGRRISNRDITDRKEAEAKNANLLAEVQAERDRMCALVASIQDEVWFADTQGRFILANPAAMHAFGLPMGEAVDVQALAASLEVLRPDGTPRPPEAAPPLRALAGEVIVNEEEVIRILADGELRYREVSAAPVRDPSGVIIGSVSVARDITDRKRAEEELRAARERAEQAAAQLAASEKRFHGLFSTMVEAFVLFELIRDEQGKVTDARALDANPALEKMTGIPPSKALGKTLRTFFPEVDFWLDTYGRVEATGQPARFERRFPPLDRVYDTLVYRPAPGQVAVLFTDSTVRHAAQQAILDIARFPDENPNPVLRVNVEGELMYANAAAREVMGLCGWHEGEPPPNQWRRIAREAREQNVIRRVEVECGELIFDMAFNPISEADYVNVYGLDITMRKRAENTILAARKELEYRINSRDMELDSVLDTLKRASAGRDEAEQRLRETSTILNRVFDNTHVLIAYLDRDFNFIRVNRAYAESDAKKPEFFPGKNHFVLYPSAGNKAIFQEVVETGQPYSTWDQPFEYAAHPDRGETYWDWSLQPIKDESGAVEGLILCLVDVTEEHRTTEELDRTRDYAVNIVETVHEGLLTLDEGLRVVTANQAFYQMFEVTPDETIGRRLCDIGNRQWDIPKLHELLAGTIRSGEPLVNVEVVHDFEKVGRRVMLLDARHLRGSADSQRVILLAIQDITERRRMTRMLARAHQRLRSLLQRIETIREEERTRIAQEVHDRLGQELTALKTGLGMLEKKIRASQAPPSNWLERLEHLSEAAAAGIESVRRISRELRPSALDHLGLSDAIAHELEQFQERTGIACRFADGADVRLTPERTTAMFRIFQEALTNVERHSQARHLDVILRETDGRAVLEVNDDGVGAPEEDIDNAETLGLLGMRERAAACDGIVEIKGVAGKGTRVTILFPAEER